MCIYSVCSVCSVYNLRFAGHGTTQLQATSYKLHTNNSGLGNCPMRQSRKSAVNPAASNGFGAFSTLFHPFSCFFSSLPALRRKIGENGLTHELGNSGEFWGNGEKLKN